jgi:hypothetical protein
LVAGAIATGGELFLAVAPGSAASGAIGAEVVAAETGTAAAGEGAAGAVLGEIAQGTSLQGAVQALNAAGASQSQAVAALMQVTANAGKNLIAATLEGSPGSIVLSGVNLVAGGTTAAIVIDASGVATFGFGAANFVNGALVISGFVPK